MRKWGAALLVAVLLSGCGKTAASPTAAPAATDAVVIAMGPTSEPEGGFDPAFGWGRGSMSMSPSSSPPSPSPTPTSPSAMIWPPIWR